MEQKRQKQIEGLRGFGLLLVVISHYVAVFQKDYCGGLDHDYLCVEYWGEIGVSVFLLISGYFIVPRKDCSAFSYIAKRLLKIWPLYFISITIIFIITRFAYLPNRTVTLVEYLLNIPFLSGFVAVHYVDQAHWYLTILLGCVFLFSILKTFSPKQRHYCYWVWCIAVVFLYFFHSSNSILHMFRGFLYVFLGKDFGIILILGAVIADINQKRIDKRFIITIALILLAKIITGTYSRFFEIPFIVGLFLLILYNKMPLFETKPMLFLGKISFPTYLIHQNLGYLLLLQIVHYAGHFSLWMSFSVIPIALGTGFLMHLLEKDINSFISKKILFE